MRKLMETSSYKRWKFTSILNNNDNTASPLVAGGTAVETGN